MSWAFLFLLLAGADDLGRFTVEGNVVNAVTGEPLRHASLAVQGTRAQDNNTSLSADAAGHFIIPDLPAGEYTIAAEKQGFTRGAPVRVEAGPSSREVTIELQPLGRIAGKVVDEYGDPILGANVQLFRAAIQNGRRVMQPASSGLTNDLGEYHVASLPAGRYYVSVTAQPDADGSAYPRTFYGGGTDIGSASPLELQPGGNERADVRMEPVRSWSVRGTIVNLPENLHPYLNIARRGALLAASEAHATQIDAATGKFEFRGITPGDWMITAGCFDKGAQLFGSSEVVVADGDAGGVTISLGKAIELEGTLHVEGANGPSAAVKGTYISLRPAGDGSQAAMGAQVKEDGTFTFAGVQPGDYFLVTRTPSPWYVKSAQFGGREITGAAFTVNPGGGGNIDITLASGGAAIYGSVVDGTATAATGVVLLLGPGQELTARIDAAGKFTFASLPPGDYTAYAFTDLQEIEYTNPAAMQRFSAARISVTEGARQQTELKLNRTVY